MEKFIIILLCLPVIAVCVFTIINPKEALLFGEKWRYNNDDLEPSEMAIDFARGGSIIILIVIGILIILPSA